MQAADPNPSAPETRRALLIALGVTGAVCALRLAVLFLTPLQLYPDEAQYWLWSQKLAWGYASKPPAIAWLIAATTALGGDGEPWVRLSAPLLHAGAALALFATGRRLYGPAVGLLACLLWTLMPAVQVSALFIATDAPLMLCLCLALWAYAALLTETEAGPRRRAALGLGLALGAAFLAKYAALFFLGSLVLHAALDRQARKAWSGGAWAVALAGLAVLAAPNLIWNAAHHFAAATHVATENVKLGGGHARLFNPGKLLEFVLGQFGVLGPIPMGVLIAGMGLDARRRRLERMDLMLLCFLLPPLLIVTVEAILSRAHAHWAAAGYTAGVVLASAWLVRWRARGWSIAALAVQGLVCLAFLLVTAWPVIGDSLGFKRRFNRIRGWDQVAVIVQRGAEAQPGLTAIAVDDRYMFNEIAYYGRGWLSAPGAPPLRMRPPLGAAHNEAELSAPLTARQGGRVLIAEVGDKPARLIGDFQRITPMSRVRIPLDGKHPREIALYLGEGFRGPVSGPTPP